VTISIPDGELRARRTLNERLGILGGLSILGTTGVVRPISHQAWTDTLEVALDVALAAEVPVVVFSTGRSSEVVAEQYLDVSEEAFVMMGDHVGYALQASHRKGVSQVVLAAQFAKLVKIACGHPQTHVGSSSLDLPRMARWARNGGLDERLAKTIECANTAREIFEKIGMNHPLTALVANRALAQLAGWAPGVAVAVLLVGYGDSEVVRFGNWPQELERKRTP
jgi:cobalt-precorrin-5B (C1)-methyltransferase